MKRTIASFGAGILVATLVSACRPQYIAPNAELGAHTQSLRAHGVTVTVPADVREDRTAEEGATPYSRYYGWAGARVRVAIEACVGVGDSGSCMIGETGFVERPAAHVGGAELRRFESMEANRPRGVVWVTPRGASDRTVVLIIGRTLGDSALVRRVADTVQPSPE